MSNQRLNVQKLKTVELINNETGEKYFYRTIAAMLKDQTNDIDITYRGWQNVAKRQRTKTKKYLQYSITVKERTVSRCVVENTKEGQKIYLLWFASDM